MASERTGRPTCLMKKDKERGRVERKRETKHMQVTWGVRKVGLTCELGHGKGWA